MKLGSTTREVLREVTEGGSFSDVLEVSKLEYDKPYRFRLLSAPYAVKRVFYPTVTTDESGTKDSWNVLNLPMDRKTVFDFIAAVDKNMKAANLPQGKEVTNVRSNLEPGKRWLVPILDKSESKPAVKVLALGWSIVEQLRDLQEAQDAEDNTMLQEGLLTMFDIVITAKRDTRKKGAEWHQRYYTVSAFRDNVFRGRVPRKALEEGIPEDTNYVEMGMFSALEWKAIETSTVDIEAETKSVSDEEIKLALEQKPLNIAYRDSDGDPWFGDPGRLIEELNRQAVNFVEHQADGVTTAALPETAKVEPEVAKEPEKSDEEMAKELHEAPAPYTAPGPPKGTAKKEKVAETVAAAPAGSKSKPAW